MKIYTKTGDKGITGIIGKRISKSSQLIEAIGSLDELNASIGLIYADSNNTEKEISNELIQIQNILFSIGGILANGKVQINLKKETKNLEQNIDKLDKNLKPLQNFILPGGNQTAAQIHLTRAICRRAERRLVELLTSEPIILAKNQNSHKDILDEILPYINRLSDYLFTLARYINHINEVAESIWNKKVN